MTSLILDGGAGRPRRILSSGDNSAEDSLRSIIQVLSVRKFPFPELTRHSPAVPDAT